MFSRLLCSWLHSFRDCHADIPDGVNTAYRPPRNPRPPAGGMPAGRVNFLYIRGELDLLIGRDHLTAVFPIQRFFVGKVQARRWNCRVAPR